MPATILEEIVSQKRQDVEQEKRELPSAALKELISEREAPRDFKRVLSGDVIKLIAEIKKASPSRGILCPEFNPLALAKTYDQSGAAALSILTEANYFQGSIDYLDLVREEVNIPLLRKDFIFDEYQVYESAAFGADALLLITAILSQEQLKELLSLSHSLGLGCLVEVHNENELDMALTSGAEIIGINNRDLNTFIVDIDTTRRLRPLVPEGRIVVSESGINDREDIKKMRDWGVNAVLVGEALITAASIPSKIKELVP
jgi:indole-3-glycerol phosphate synthase